MNNKSIGTIIAEAREKVNLSQKQFAKLLKISDIKLSKIELGELIPSPRLLRKISQHINLNYEELMYMIGRGLDVSPLNIFLQHYYSKLKVNELNEAELNILKNIKKQEELMLSCAKRLNDENISKTERDLLFKTIEDTNYEVNTQKEIVKLIKSLKIRQAR